jgi:cytochrome b
MNTGPSSKVRVWNPLVRVFHWGLVAAFATAWLTADEVQPLHEIAGYTAAGLVTSANMVSGAKSRAR